MKYQHSDIFGSSELETEEPTWQISECPNCKTAVDKAVAKERKKVWNEAISVVSRFSRSIRKVDVMKALEAARKETE